MEVETPVADVLIRTKRAHSGASSEKKLVCCGRGDALPIADPAESTGRGPDGVGVVDVVCCGLEWVVLERGPGLFGGVETVYKLFCRATSMLRRELELFGGMETDLVVARLEFTTGGCRGVALAVVSFGAFFEAEVLSAA